MSCCLPSWTTFTLSPHLNELAMCGSVARRSMLKSRVSECLAPVGPPKVCVCPVDGDHAARAVSLGSTAGARATCLLRVVRPDLVRSFAERHNRGLWQCLARILGLSCSKWDTTTQDVASLPLLFGGLGLRSAALISPSANLLACLG